MQYLLIAAEQLQPHVEHSLSSLGEGIHPPRGPGFRRVPEGRDQPGAFQLSKRPVDSRRVEAREAGLSQFLHELIAACIPAAQVGQQAGAEQIAVQARTKWRAYRFAVMGCVVFRVFLSCLRHFLKFALSRGLTSNCCYVYSAPR